MIYALSVGFGLLIVLSIPIGIGLALSSMIGIEFFSNVPLDVAAQRLVAGIRSYPLLAIPLYVLAGALMNASGITQRLIDFAYAIVGGLRGGLSHVTILTAAIFNGVSGSQVADTSSIGRIMIPQMTRRGYQAKRAAAVVAAAGALFLTIPPSINLIVYGVLAQVSISDLFFYGLLAGLALVLVLLVTSYVVAVRNDDVAEGTAPRSEIFRAFRRAIPALLFPVVILGGIRMGVFTATEGGAVGVLFALFVGFVVYRELTLKKLWRSLVDSSVLVGVIMLVIAAAQIYSFALTIGQIPQQLANALLSLTENPILILLLINALILIVGTVLEANAALIIFVPILLPVATAVGIDPVHLGIILVLNLGIGLLTPPVGICILISSKIAKVPVQNVLPVMVPWFVVAFAFLLAVTLLPYVFGWGY